MAQARASASAEPRADRPAPMRSRGWWATTTRRYPVVISILSITVLLLVWEFFGREANPLLTSHPTAVFDAFLEQLRSGELIEAFLQSIRALFVGYLLAVVVGIPIGLLIGRYWRAEAALGFYFLALDATPLVAFIPLYILWFGLYMLVKVMIIFTFAITRSSSTPGWA